MKGVKFCKLLLIKCLIRNIRNFVKLIAVNGSHLLAALKRHEKKIIKSIITMFHQQETMFKKGTHSIADRIISIFQPHIPPIVRGKAKATTEFSAKIGASVVHGYTFIENHSWDAYNEEANLELQIELYRKRLGCLPSRIYADKIYMNRENRNLMKNLEIEAMGKPLERPLKNPDMEYEKRMTKAAGERNEVEATFGTGKRIYRANNIRAKLPETANCWTGMCYFIKNVMKFIKELFHTLFEIWILMKNIATIPKYSANVAGLQHC